MFPCRHLYLQDKAHVTCATFHKPNRILITGFTNGVFTLHEMPEFHPMHSLRYLLSFIIIWAIYLSLPLLLLFSLPLHSSFPCPSPLLLSPSLPLLPSISDHRITSVAVNRTGEWLGFGSSTLGQLLVWEWRSETHILKQQSHHHEMNVMCYSPDGQLIVTGGDDGKVWAVPLLIKLVIINI